MRATSYLLFATAGSAVWGLPQTSANTQRPASKSLSSQNLSIEAESLLPNLNLRGIGSSKAVGQDPALEFRDEIWINEQTDRIKSALEEYLKAGKAKYEQMLATARIPFEAVNQELLAIRSKIAKAEAHVAEQQHLYDEHPDTSHKSLYLLEIESWNLTIKRLQRRIIALEATVQSYPVIWRLHDSYGIWKAHVDAEFKSQISQINKGKEVKHIKFTTFSGRESKEQ